MSNPLLEMSELPPFSKIKPEHIEPAIDSVLSDSRQQIQNLLDSNTQYTWSNLIQPMEEIDDVLNKVWSPISHMNSVVNSDELREAYNACLPKLTEYGTEMGQHQGIFKAIQSIVDSSEFVSLDTAQKKSLENDLRDFRLSGIGLEEQDKQRYKQIKQEL